MTEHAVERRPDPARSPGRDGSGFVLEGVRVRSALLHLDGVFEPAYLVVDGEVDLTTHAAFTTALSSVVEHGCGDVWVDVERLTFIDVGGLRALAAAACRLGLQDRRLVLRSVAPHLARLMDLVGWSQIPSLQMLARDETRPSRP
ncbi:STAS domain-containing protein [Actinomadura sp. LOL_016]|uniref:STAS domain-containing protein n=1 Tax=unclassified Actinomadura TaxID=2626254 RepID=UPI003A813BF5